jgi:hypothetical protein
VPKAFHEGEEELSLCPGFPKRRSHWQAHDGRMNQTTTKSEQNPARRREAVLILARVEVIQWF